MAEKGFGVKEINLIGASGTPTIESPNNLNLNAVNVAISTNVSIGGTLSVTGNVSVGGTLTYEDVTNIDSVGLITARSGVKVSAGSSINIGIAVTLSDGSNKGDLCLTGVSTAQRYQSHNGYSMDAGAYNNGYYINSGGNTILGMAYYSNNTIGLGGNGSSPLAFIIDDVSTISLNPTSGACNLNYAGSGKLQTTNTGVNVTGAITVNGSALSIDPTNSDIQVVYTVTANGSSAYRFAGNGVVSTADDPDLYLIRGQKYRFINNSGGSHPFQIRVSDGGSAYSTGVTNNGASSGNIDFAPTFDSPAQLVYQCTSHSGMVGNIYLRDAAGNNTNVGVVTATAFIPTQGQLSHRNIIVNGAMMVAQRGVTSTVSGYGSVDRFRLMFGGHDEALTQAQHTLSTSDTPYSLGFRYSFHITNGNQTSGAGGTDYAQLLTTIEAQDIASSGWNYTSSSSFITLSFWVKSSVAQNFYGALRTQDGTVRSFPFETGSLTANTWKKVIIKIPGDSSSTYNNDTGAGLQIFMWAFRGTDYTGSVTLNQWNTWNTPTGTPDFTSTWWTTNDATLEFTGYQLEVGPVATPFEHMSYGQELERCKRYFYKWNADGDSGSTYFLYSGAYSSHASSAFFDYTYQPEMRAIPSATTPTANNQSGGSWSLYRYRARWIASANSSSSGATFSSPIEFNAEI